MERGIMSIAKSRKTKQEPPREPRFSWVELRGLLRYPIAYHRIFATIGGGAMPGLFLSQCFYWTDRTAEDADGWFYKSGKEWEKETGLTRTEQETARRKLIARDILETDNRGVPATLHYRIKQREFALAIEDAVAAAQFVENPQTEFVENPQTGMKETRKLVRGKPANKRAGKSQTLTETKEETKRDSAGTGDFNKSFNGRNGTANASDKHLAKSMESAAKIAFTELLDAKEQGFIREQARFQGKSITEVMCHLKDYEVQKALRAKT